QLSHEPFAAQRLFKLALVGNDQDLAANVERGELSLTRIVLKHPLFGLGVAVDVEVVVLHAEAVELVAGGAGIAAPVGAIDTNVAHDLLLSHGRTEQLMAGERASTPSSADRRRCARDTRTSRRS